MKQFLGDGYFSRSSFLVSFDNPDFEIFSQISFSVSCISGPVFSLSTLLPRRLSLFVVKLSVSCVFSDGLYPNTTHLKNPHISGFFGFRFYDRAISCVASFRLYDCHVFRLSENCASFFLGRPLKRMTILRSWTRFPLMTNFPRTICRNCGPDAVCEIFSQSHATLNLYS